MFPALFRRPVGVIRPTGAIPKIDWSHPLAKGLVFYGIDLGNGQVMDLVTGRLGTPAASPPAYAASASAFGTANKYPDASTTAGLSFKSTPAIQAVTTPFTWAAGCIQSTTATTSDAVIFGRLANDGASDPYLNWQICANHQGVNNTTGASWSASGATEQKLSSGWPAVTNGSYASFLLVHTGSAVNEYLNGSTTVTGTNASATYQSVNTNDDIVFGYERGFNHSFTGLVFYGALWQGNKSAFALQLHIDPYCFLVFPDAEIPIGGTTAGNNATLNITEDADTIAATATVLVSASLAATEANDTLAATATVLVTASLSSTEANDTISATAAVLVQASLSATEADDTLSATAISGISASLAVTEANDTIAATATVSVSAILSAIEASDIIVASATVLVQANAALSEDADTLAATCNTLGVSAINAVLFATEQDDRILAAIHRNSYIPNPTERGHYISRWAPKPWLRSSAKDCPDN